MWKRLPLWPLCLSVGLAWGQEPAPGVPGLGGHAAHGLEQLGLLRHHRDASRT